jgi:hypothetical protein
VPQKIKEKTKKEKLQTFAMDPERPPAIRCSVVTRQEVLSSICSNLISSFKKNKKTQQLSSPN